MAADAAIRGNPRVGAEGTGGSRYLDAGGGNRVPEPPGARKALEWRGIIRATAVPDDSELGPSREPRAVGDGARELGYSSSGRWSGAFTTIQPSTARWMRPAERRSLSASRRVALRTWRRSRSSTVGSGRLVGRSQSRIAWAREGASPTELRSGAAVESITTWGGPSEARRMRRGGGAGARGARRRG